MLFNSIEFLIFFVAVVVAYFAIPSKYRWMLLLIASYWFYMSAKVEYGILLFISTVMGYFGAFLIESAQDQGKRKVLLWGSIFVNLSMLLFFKYANFISDNVRALFGIVGLEFSPFALKVVLPIGISFYTFQAISYTIDVYNKRIAAERHFGIYAVYHAFFPQLVAGPIERGGHLLPQFREVHVFRFSDMTNGLQLMLWGLFKKVVIADNLAIVVNKVYNNPYMFEGWPLILATLFFVVQIYCDFSGYSDIARGVAKVIGFDLVINFNRPFISKNIGEFWRRWHISLSSWFQDYVFTPLYLSISRWKSFQEMEPSKKHTFSFLIAILIVETLLGFWHGANWTFILFGLYHGILIPLYYFSRAWWDRMPQVIQVGATFILVSFGLLIFRSGSVREAVFISTHMFSGLGKSLFGFDLGFFLPGFMFYVFLIALLFLIEMLIEDDKVNSIFLEKPMVRKAVSIVLIVAILFFGNFNKTQFIYFQF